jgi:hypothetical protein
MTDQWRVRYYRDDHLTGDYLVEPHSKQPARLDAMRLPPLGVSPSRPLSVRRPHTYRPELTAHL